MGDPDGLPILRERYLKKALVCLFLLLSAPTLHAQEQHLPPLSDADAAQFPAIGRLAQGGFRVRQGCTATLIAPDLILTAAHCVSETGSSSRVFAAGWSRGDYIAASGTLSEMRHPSYGSGGRHGPSNDIALVILESPIKDVTPIPLGDMTALELDGTPAALIGYHRRTPHILSGDFACPLGRFHVGLMQVGCPVINGNSGAPLLNKDANGNWQVVGVISSQLGAGAIAVEIPVWIKRKVAGHLGQ